MAIESRQNGVIAQLSSGENLRALWRQIKSSGSYERDDGYEVQLQRGGFGEHFGLTYRANLKGKLPHLVVTAAHTVGSPVAVWNKSCDLEESICTGDLILCVNGKTEPKDMVAELKNNLEVSIGMLKTGPRWHLMGVTAEAMERMDKAKSKGVYFQIMMPHEQEERKANMVPLNAFHAILVFAAIALPNALLCGLFSDMGWGLFCYSVLASYNMNLLGNALLGFGSFLVVCAYIADFVEWRRRRHKAIMMLMIVYAFAIGLICKSRFYPQFPLLVILFHMLMFLGVLRATVLKPVKRASFYRCTASIMIFSGISVLALWLIWMNAGWDGETHRWNSETKAQLTADSHDIYELHKPSINGRERTIIPQWDCDKNRQMTDYTLDGNTVRSNGQTIEADDDQVRQDRCASVKTTWFLTWVSPMLAVGCDIVLGLFCVVNGTVLKENDLSKLEKVLKQFVVSLCVLLLIMYVSVSVAGASMRLTSTILALCVVSMVALVIWAYLEIGKRTITAAVTNSKLMTALVKIATSDLARAAAVIALNCLIPTFLLLNIMKQKARNLRGTATNDGLFTDSAMRVINAVKGWNWSSILVKANWLAIVYWVFFIGVSKWSYVFLSWLNDALGNVEFGLVMFIFFWIGFIMFMLPPVPGIPVYVCSGIILSDQARDIDGLGFWGGMVLAIFLSFVLKLVASSGQYFIGYFLGKSVKVQQLIGVDKVFTRGIESVLQQRGLALSKVSVLVGGPDWPTSVLCGILKLNLLQVIIGTLPVILVSSPCVITGAFMANPAADRRRLFSFFEDSSAISLDRRLATSRYIIEFPQDHVEVDDTKEEAWRTIASTTLGLSLLAQGGMSMLAMYFIQREVFNKTEELSKPRKEHEAVAALTKAEEDYNEMQAIVLKWGNLKRSRRILLLASCMMMLGSCFVFVFLDSMCYRSFEVSSSIKDDFADGGLNGNALNIMLPLGVLATVVFFISIFLHWLFLRWAKSATMTALAQAKERQSGKRSSATASTGVVSRTPSNRTGQGSRAPSRSVPVDQERMLSR
mmetsp:Transcript_7887/g.17388  ORF Transcript_7887/g.17388 Transcript_7887/m.17388 type:complete len:1037 (-) Transcript_7887:44-3154(-)